MKINLAIVDDDHISGEIAKKFIAKIPEFDLKGYFDDPISFLNFTKTNDIDLVITDIEMPNMNGFELVKALPESTSLIFMTAHREFAAEAFDLDGIDYLVKPFSFERFQKASNKAVEYYKSKKDFISTPDTSTNIYQSENDHFFIKTDSQFVKLEYSEVIFMEAMKDFVKIYTPKNTYVAYITLKILEEQLPSEIFIRTHRSFIANMKRIDSLTQTDIKILDYTIPLGNLFKDKVFGTLVDKNLIKR
jgi:DNA-binding LytR/AlgR family response regulator